MSATDITGDRLLPLLGLASTSDEVQELLSRLARGMQPELSPDDETAFVDWVTVNEIGFECGFQDQAYLHALDPSLRRRGALLLSQLYFYGDTPKTAPFPYSLPFHLDFADDRTTVRRKLAGFEQVLRPYVRDAWHLPEFNVTAAYRAEDGRLESVLCYLPPKPWPISAETLDVVALFPPHELCELFGVRWSSATLRHRLEPLGYVSGLPDVRRDHNADLRLSYGIEFGFAPGRQVPGSAAEFPGSLALASVTYYGPRVHDAVAWAGEMPEGLSFDDSQEEILERVGRRPDERADYDRFGFALWHFDRYSLRAEYSNIENCLLRATMTVAGYRPDDE